MRRRNLAVLVVAVAMMLVRTHQTAIRGLAASSLDRLLRRPHVEMFGVIPAAVPDTAAVVVRWTATVDAKGNAVARYLWRITNQLTGTAIASDSTANLSDTVKVARPLPGDSLVLVASVAARDSKGNIGNYGNSKPITIPGRPWTPPLPPGTITVDTLAVGPADSAWIVVLAPDSVGSGRVYYVTAGDTIQACGYSWRSGVLSASRSVTGWASTNPLLLTDLGVPGPEGFHCRLFATNPNVGQSGLRRLLRTAIVGPNIRFAPG